MKQLMTGTTSENSFRKEEKLGNSSIFLFQGMLQLCLMLTSLLVLHSSSPHRGKKSDG